MAGGQVMTWDILAEAFDVKESKADIAIDNQILILKCCVKSLS